MLEHKAFLSSPPDPVIKALGEMAEKNGFAVRRDPGRVVIDAPLGEVTFVSQPAGTEVIFGAESPAKLQLLKDLYAGRLADLGVTETLRWDATEARWPLNQMFGHVVAKDQISPNFMRLRLAGDFNSFHAPGAGLHFRLLLPARGADWPRLDARGLTDWPGGVKNWHRPPFTVRAISGSGDWLDVDIVLHDGGRITAWVRDVPLGAEVALHGPNGGGVLPDPWLGLIGDETALPVIARLVEGAGPDTEGQAFILVRDAADAQPIKTASQIEVTWRVMGKDDPVALIHALTPPKDRYQIFFAAERSQASQAREVYKTLGYPSKLAKAASYWTAV